MNKNITYNLNEANLRTVFERYEVSFDEAHWAETEKSLDSLGLQRKDMLSGKAKKLVLFSCLILVGGGLAAFINYNTNSRNSSGSDLQDIAATETAGEMIGMKIEAEAGMMRIQRKATVATAPVDSVKPVTVTRVPVKQIAVQVQPKPAQQEVSITVPEQTLRVADKESVDAKKKIRRKKNADSGSASTPVPVTRSHADDDIVIDE